MVWVKVMDIKIQEGKMEENINQATTQDQVSQKISEAIKDVFPVSQELNSISNGIKDGSVQDGEQTEKIVKDLIETGYLGIINFDKGLLSYINTQSKNNDEPKESKEMVQENIAEKEKENQGLPVNQLAEIALLNSNIEQLIRLESEVREEASKLNKGLKECKLDEASEDIHGLTETFQEYVKEVKRDYQSIIEDLKENRKRMEKSTEKLRDESFDIMHREGNKQFVIYGAAVCSVLTLIVSIVNLFV